MVETLNRRAIVSGVVAAAGIVTAARSLGADSSAAPMATAPMAPPAFAGKHAVVPLPFNPARVNGLSEKLLVSHHDNNYAAAVNNLNRLEKDLAAVTKETPGFVVGGLRQNELMYRNSMTLHEAYFGNLGGDGKVSGGIVTALKNAYGSQEAWELQARATATSLGGGSGWVVLAMELMTGELRTHAANHHTQALAASMPLLVMDMYEHAYAIDFGAAAARYIDAFFGTIQWDVVNQRLEKAQKLSQLLRA